jgi:ABC-type antimicrobial peptide transport system permease subunit
MVRTGGDPASLTAPLTRRLAAFAPASALDWVGPVDRWLVDMFLLDERFVAYLLAAFSTAALLLSAVGLSGLLADSVARRRAELGVRQVLGATPRRILLSVVAHGVGVALAGLATGAALAWLAGRLLAAFLHGTAAGDPWSFAATAAVLLAAALAASAVPARRAARLDPGAALRNS